MKDFNRIAGADREAAENLKISIVVPVYNDRNTVCRCVDSLVNQTLREIEMILVDDCSTDGTRELLAEYARKDPRIRAVYFDRNRSAFQARKRGVELSTGRYIMFVDADDELEAEACKTLWELEQENPVDILHFGTNVITDSAEPEKIEGYKKLINPVEEQLSGEEIFRAFTDRKFEGHLWNKIFRRDLCVLALSKAGDYILPKGQDKYFYWIMAFYARSYRGVPSCVLYNYHYGMGIEGAAKRRDLGTFETFCRQSWTENAIERFMTEHAEISRYEEVIRASRRNLLRHCVKNWRLLEREAQAQGLHMMLQYWDREGDRGELAAALGEAFRGSREELIEIVKQYNRLYPGRRKKTRTIGTYYHIFNNGGIQRVISKLIELWMQNGYEVVLFTDYESGNDYELPRGAVRVLVDRSGRAASEKYAERGISLERLLKKYHIDTMVYHDYFGGSLLWDLLLCRFMEIPFILYYHNVFTKYLIFQDERFYQLPGLAPLCDGMAVLSDTDKRFWAHYNGNVHKVTNPLSFQPKDIHRGTLRYPNVVWVGRLDEIQKRFNEPVTIMRKVVQEIPDAKLFIVGRDDSGENFEKLRNRIRKLKLESTVILCGFQKQVEPFYEMASVHLMTSTHEGSPMALIEALSYGIPTVMYELPYLELVKGNGGIRAVKQGDTEAAAAEICRLLSDSACRMETGKCARAYLESFYSGVDICQEWEDLFASVSEGRISRVEEDDKILFDTLLLHYRFSLELHPKASLQSQLDEAGRKLGELREENERLKQEYGYLMAGFEGMKHGWSMRIGSLATWPLRKLRDLVRKGKQRREI